MNRLTRALCDLDHGSVTQNKNGLSVFWIHPVDREHKRPIDTVALYKLIAAGYVVLDDNKRLRWTDRGYSIVLAYRPNAQRQPALYPNYRNWLNNARIFQQYLKDYESCPTL